LGKIFLQIVLECLVSQITNEKSGFVHCIRVDRSKNLVGGRCIRRIAECHEVHA
jgi:hypothetical protein